MVMTLCDGELSASARKARSDPVPSPAADSPAALADPLRLRAERARDEALALCAWNEALTHLETSRQELLARSPLARLRAQLATMPVIEQAKGILIFQQGCNPDEAFDLLRRASQRSNVPVRVLAEQIVSRAQQPGSSNNRRT
jgi:hypothetical protein